MFAPVTVNVAGVQDPRVLSIDMIDVRAVQPPNDFSRSVEDGLHRRFHSGFEPGSKIRRSADVPFSPSNGWAFSGEPSGRSERPERNRGRRVRCNAMFGGGII